MLGRLARIANKGFPRFTSSSNSDLMVELGGNVYPLSKAERVYKKLTSPRTTGEFFNQERVRGIIRGDGGVEFYASWLELATPDNPEGWSLLSPQERGIEQVSPTPQRGLIDMIDAFNRQVKNPEGTTRSFGAGLYYNIPISERRSEFYQRRAGFTNINLANKDRRFQVLDNRRFTNSPTIAELLMLGDAGHIKDLVVAEVLRERWLTQHSQLREKVEQRIALESPFGPPDIPASSEETDSSLINWKVKLLQNLLSLFGK